MGVHYIHGIGPLDHGLMDAQATFIASFCFGFWNHWIFWQSFWHLVVGHMMGAYGCHVEKPRTEPCLFFRWPSVSLLQRETLDILLEVALHRRHSSCSQSLGERPPVKTRNRGGREQRPVVCGDLERALPAVSLWHLTWWSPTPCSSIQLIL